MVGMVSKRGLATFWTAGQLTQTEMARQAAVVCPDLQAMSPAIP